MFDEICAPEGDDMNNLPSTFSPYFGLSLPVLSVTFLEAYEEFKDP